MTAIKTTRNCSGFYTVSDGERSVNVTRVTLDDGEWWIAAANWTRTQVTDPLYTKRDAVRNARYMLEEATQHG